MNIGQVDYSTEDKEFARGLVNHPTLVKIIQAVIYQSIEEEDQMTSNYRVDPALSEFSRIKNSSKRIALGDLMDEIKYVAKFESDDNIGE